MISITRIIDTIQSYWPLMASLALVGSAEAPAWALQSAQQVHTRLTPVERAACQSQLPHTIAYLALLRRHWTVTVILATLLALFVLYVTVDNRLDLGDGSWKVLSTDGTRELWMSSYLAQSLVFVAFLPAWTMGYGGRLSVWQLTLVALGAWALITALAACAGRAGVRGPAEVLLRRLTYGRPSSLRR